VGLAAGFEGGRVAVETLLVAVAAIEVRSVRGVGVATGVSVAGRVGEATGMTRVFVTGTVVGVKEG